VDRRAKYLLLGVSSGAVMVLHLGMTGRLWFFAEGDLKVPHDHLRFLLDSGVELRFNDVRRFGSVRVFAPGDPGCTLLFAHLGAEPLGPAFSGSYLMKKARNRLRPLKNFLMDARVVAGIGNIYANEILFAAGIEPIRPVGTLNKAEWHRVAQASQQVLERSIACGGTTISDFVSSSGQAGYFQCELKVYGREGEPCENCGRPIVRQVLAGRACFYCSKCQK
jgi:formamidopyrimidine-DNA glycosylase